MFVIIGLGNPGRKYVFTRHNVGFLLLDNIATKLNIPFSAGKGDYYFVKSELSGKPVLLVKPTTYMNNSGVVFQQIRDFFKIELDDLLIIYDDFHLPFGTLRFRARGADAGHNGIKSIIYHLQSNVFARLKIGIGSHFIDSVEHVLSKFNHEESESLPDILDEAYKGIQTWIVSGIQSAMNNHNRNVLDKDGVE